MENALYLYCLARADLLPVIEGIGVDGQNPLSLQNIFDIAAVLSMVSLDEFSGPSAESRMKELSWIGLRSWRHEEAVEKVMRHSPVLPARFGTIFSSLQRLETFVKKHHGAISNFLGKVADKDEWAVKGMLDKVKAREELFSDALAGKKGGLSASPGMRYIQEQRIRADIERGLNSWLKEACGDIAESLNRCASDFCERPVISQKNPENNKDIIMNWAFLVPRDAATDFHDRIHQANADRTRCGLSFECTGPWPPYSFSPCLEMESEV